VDLIQKNDAPKFGFGTSTRVDIAGEILEISITVQHLSLMEKATKLHLLFNLNV
jgi:hypothetical protein